MFIRIFINKWSKFWMRYAGLSPSGRIATRFTTWLSPSYKGRRYLARLSANGYISPDASILHDNLHLHNHVFIGERVVIYQAQDGGPVKIGSGTHMHRDCIVETGSGGTLTIGADTHIQPRCQFSAYLGAIRVGCGVQIAPNCALYPYNHGFAPDELIMKQPLQTSGDIVIDDDALLGVAVIVLDKVRIGKGAVIGAGSVVTRDVPDGAIAVGVPARVVKMRSEL